MSAKKVSEMTTSELLNLVSDRIAMTEGWSNLVTELRNRADQLDAHEASFVNAPQRPGDPCLLCRTRVKDWQGSDPVCAFRTSVFSPNNWRCATMDVLCGTVYDHSTWSQDHVVFVRPVPGLVMLEGGSQGLTHVVLYKYKNRGQVLAALVFDVEGRQHPLSVGLAVGLAKLVSP